MDNEWKITFLIGGCVIVMLYIGRTSLFASVGTSRGIKVPSRLGDVASKKGIFIGSNDNIMTELGYYIYVYIYIYIHYIYIYRYDITNCFILYISCA